MTSARRRCPAVTASHPDRATVFTRSSGMHCSRQPVPTITVRFDLARIAQLHAQSDNAWQAATTDQSKLCVSLHKGLSFIFLDVS